MTVVEVEYVDHGVAGEYGPFGKVIARSDVRGMSADEIAAEVREMKAIVGAHVDAVLVEQIPAVS